MGRLRNFLSNTKLLDFPGFRQTYKWNCGTTSLNMVLAYYGNDINEVELIKTSEANKEIGTPIEGLKKAAKGHGLKFKEDYNMTTDDLRKNVDAGHPTLIMIQTWSKLDNPDWKNEWDQGHYTVCIGYDEKKLIFADPISITRVFLSDSGLNSRWHGFGDDGKKIGKWGLTFTNTPKYDKNDIEEMG